jgi:hypothetical protein
LQESPKEKELEDYSETYSDEFKIELLIEKKDVVAFAENSKVSLKSMNSTLEYKNLKLMLAQTALIF